MASASADTGANSSEVHTDDGWTLMRPDQEVSSSVLPWQAVDPIEETLLQHKKVGVMGMVCIAFFWVSGGIYGNEELIGAAPGLYVLMLVVVMPLVFSLPIALITAELASAFPVDGGQCVYVQRACGDAVGGHNCFYVFVINIIDATVYPLIAAQYLGYHVEMTYLQSRLFVMALICAVTAINLLGLEALTRFQGIIFVITLLPCLAFIGAGLPSLDFAAFTRTNNAPVDVSLLLSWVIWLYSGFSSLGTIAGECDKPHVTYVRTIGILFPLVIALNTLPFAVALSLDPDVSHYQAGYFAQLAGEQVGDWLRLGFVIASNVALVGLFNSQAITAQCTVFFFAESRSEYKQLRLDVLAAATRTEGSVASVVVPWLLDVPMAGVPRVYILLTACCSCCLCWLPYGVLVEFEVLLYCVSQLLFFYAFVYLRAAYPDAGGKFRIGTGVRSALATVFIPVCICVANLYIGLYVPQATCEDSAPGTGSMLSTMRRALGAVAGAGSGDAPGANVTPPPADASYDPGPNFKQQGFVTVILIGGLIHGASAMWVAPEVEVVPPDEPLDAPLTPSRRTSELQVVLGSGAPSEESGQLSPAHAAASALLNRRPSRPRIDRTSTARSRSVSRDGSTLYDAEAILDSLLPQLAFATSTTMRVDEASGLVLNREEILAAFQESMQMQQQSEMPIAGIVL